MRFSSKAFPALILASTFLFFACASGVSTQLTSVNKSPEYSGGPIQSFLVVGVAKKPENRALFEDKLVTELKKAGAKAYAGHLLFPGESGIAEEDLRAEARKLGAQGVLVCHVKSVDEKVQRSPASMTVAPVTLGGHYGTVYTNVMRPGSVSRQVTVRLQCDLFDTGTEKGIWSATSKTVDPGSVKALIASVCDEFAKSLKQNGLLGK